MSEQNTNRIETTVSINIKRENIVDGDSGLMLNSSDELKQDMLAVYGIDLTNIKLLETLKKYNGITIRVI